MSRRWSARLERRRAGAPPSAEGAAPRDPVARNFSALAAAALVARLLAFGLAIALARGLGPDDYGLYTLAAAIVTIVNAVGEAGLTPYVTREVARDRPALDRLLPRLLMVRLALAGAGGLAVLVWLIAEPGAGLTRALAIVYLMMTLESLSYLGYAYLQGLERMRFEAASTVAVAAVRVGGGIALVVLTSSLEIVLGWMALVSALQLAAVGSRLRREGAGRAAPVAVRTPPARAIAASAGSMMVVILLNAVILRADAVVIGVVNGARDVGQYTAAYALVTGVQVVPWVLSVAVYPALARTFRRDDQGLRRITGAAMRAAVILTVPAAVLMTVLAEPVVARLYGAAYSAAAAPLAILMWWVPLAAISALGGAMLRAADREWLLARVIGVAAAVNVGGNLVAVPLFGLKGAAAVTVAMEVGVAVALLLAARRLGMPLPAAGAALRALPALAALAACAAALAALPVEARIAASLALYLAALVAFGAVSREDVRQLRGALRPAVR